MLPGIKRPKGPDLAAEAPAEAALEATTPKAETTAEATTRRAEATAEAAAHKAKEPAEASAQTETEAPVTAARAKAPADDAATRKPWWNLFEVATSALSPSLPSSKASPPSSAMTRLARPALSWPARETPAPPSTTTGRALPQPPP